MPHDRERGAAGEWYSTRLHALDGVQFGFISKNGNADIEEKWIRCGREEKEYKKYEEQYIAQAAYTQTELPSQKRITHMSAIRSPYVPGYAGYTVTSGQGGYFCFFFTKVKRG
jgi:hypothetical protein